MTPDFDSFVDGLDYPMFVVTAASGRERAGCLVGFATQASIDPPRMLVCLSTANHTYRVAARAALLGVHALAPQQRELAELFGGSTGDEVDKLAQCSWHPGPDGVPLLEEVPRRLVGRILSRHELGDHVGFLLEPVAVDAEDTGDGLGYEQVEDVEPGHPAGREGAGEAGRRPC